MSTLTRMQPALWNELQNYFGGSHLQSSIGGNVGGSVYPRADVIEQADHYLFFIELPGVDAKDIDIAVQPGMLTVKGKQAKSAEWRKAQQCDGAYFLMNERQSTTFVRQFTLPDVNEGSALTAVSKFGVLQITLQKTAKTANKKVSIKVEG